MRKFLCIFAISLSVVVGMSGPAAARTGDHASGRGVDSEGGTFSFRARGTGTGQDATGSFRYESAGGLILVGEVYCMIANPTTVAATTLVAQIRGVITGGSDSAFINDTLRIGARDKAPDSGDPTGDGYFSDVVSIGAPCEPGTVHVPEIQSGRVKIRVA